MNRKLLAYVVLLVVSMIGYNAFLISRDQKLFEAYYETRNETAVGTAANR